MVSSLCHDVDHRGTTNSFQLASNSVLAALYSSEGSVMEVKHLHLGNTTIVRLINQLWHSIMQRHHFAQSMCILNTEGCNIFENLSSRDYTRCLDLMQDIILGRLAVHFSFPINPFQHLFILATDLAHHLRISKNLKDLVQTGFDKSCSEHHQLLLYLMMTSADLSDQTKDWKSSRNAAVS